LACRADATAKRGKASAIGTFAHRHRRRRRIADTTLEVYDGNGALLASNDDWKVRADGTSQEAEIHATTIPPADDRESAIAINLVPGNYTSVLRGKANTTGVSLIEVYHLQ
jgi:hypothetical protein